MYRVQLFGPRLAAMHWHMHHDGARHFRKWQTRGEKMPLAIVLGGEIGPALRRHRAAAAGHVRNCSSPASSTAAGSSWCKCKTIDLRSPRQRRDRHRRLRRSDRKAARRPLRRSHRLLFAGRLVSRVPRHRDHASGRTRSTRRRSSASRRWRTISSARPPSASSCRCCKMLDPRHRRLLPADQRRVPQLRVRQDPQGIPATRPAG